MSEKFCNILISACLCVYIMGPKLFKAWKISAVIYSIAIVSSYILSITSLHEWFECYTDEVQYILIQELMLYKFKQGHNAMEATKNISCAKGEGIVDHWTVTRWFKKFYSGCKNFADQARSNRPRTEFKQGTIAVITTKNICSAVRE